MGKVYNAGGWGGTGRKYEIQRSDQGQDFEIALDGWITSPGDGIVVEHAADGPFPYGFGDPYAIVHITSGPFSEVGDGVWYVGHANADVAPVGTKLRLGSHIARANNSLHAGYGWCEVGKWDGGPHAMGEGTQFAHLFVPYSLPKKPLRKGSRGIRVVKLTRRLAYIRPAHSHGHTYLGRRYFHFKQPVVDAVRAFQEDHRLKVDGVVGPKTGARIQEVFKRQFRGDE